MALAQVVEILAEVEPVSAIGSWLSLGASGILSALLVWILTTYIPGRDKTERESRKAADDLERESRETANKLFAEVLAEHRKQSADLAKGGHAAVEHLSVAFRELAVAITSYPESRGTIDPGVARRRRELESE